MPRRGSLLVPFLFGGLNSGSYRNLFWLDETRGFFKLTFTKFGSRGPWRHDEEILKDYEKLMKRNYKSYSKARGTLNSAMSGSDFLCYISKIKNGAVYQFKSYADAQTEKHKNDTYASDGETMSASPMSLSSDTSSVQSCDGNVCALVDHSYIKTDNPTMNDTPSCVSPETNSSYVLNIKPLPFVPDFEDIIDVINGDQEDASGTNCVPRGYAECPRMLPNSLGDSYANVLDQRNDFQVLIGLDEAHSDACGCC